MAQKFRKTRRTEKRRRRCSYLLRAEYRRSNEVSREIRESGTDELNFVRDKANRAQRPTA